MNRYEFKRLVDPPETALDSWGRAGFSIISVVANKFGDPIVYMQRTRENYPYNNRDPEASHLKLNAEPPFKSEDRVNVE